MPLDIQQQMLIEQRVGNDAKSPLIAYLLLLFVGGFGAHRFYLGRTGSAAAILVLWVLGWITLPFGIGIVPLAIVGVWVLVDLFLIPGMIAHDKDRLRSRLRQDIEMASPRMAMPIPMPVPGAPFPPVGDRGA